MVEYNPRLDNIFGSLADPTRRDILERVARKEQSVTEIAKAYVMSIAAVSKHLKILEKAGLILKRSNGQQRLVSADLTALKAVELYLQNYEELWNQRFDRLETLLAKEDK